MPPTQRRLTRVPPGMPSPCTFPAQRCIPRALVLRSPRALLGTAAWLSGTSRAAHRSPRVGHRGPEPHGVRAGDNKGGVWGQRSGTPRQSPFPGSVACCDLWAEKPLREEEGALGRLFPAGFQLLKSPLVAVPCPWAQGLPVLYTRCWGGPGELCHALPCHIHGVWGQGHPIHRLLGPKRAVLRESSRAARPGMAPDGEIRSWEGWQAARL